MSRSEDLRLDATLRAGWAASEPSSPHLDESGWEAFLEGRLDPGAREAALDHVSSCVRCAEVFKSARAAALAEMRWAAPPRATAARALPQFATVAAALAVAALALFIGRPADAPRSLALESPPPAIAPNAPAGPPTRPRMEKAPLVVSAEQLLSTRGGRGDAAYLKALAKALEPYERDEFGEAAKRLAPLASEHPGAFEPAFYLGVSLLLDGRPQEAVAVLEGAQRLAGAVRAQEAARWLTAARAAVPVP